MTPTQPANDLSLQARRELISRLADGDADCADAACGHWREHADAREAWHVYHLIGDVLRSDDLAGAAAPAGGERFLASLRVRLQQEAVVLAPAPSLPPRSAPWRWPLALAAGVMAVGAVVVVWQVARDAGGLAPLQAGAGDHTPVPTLAAADPAWQPVHGKMIRDERLDSYLRLHRGGVGGRFETVVLER